MSVYPKGTSVKVRRVFQVGGIGPPLKFGVHNNSLANLRRGLMERVYYVEDSSKNLVPAPSPNPGVFKELQPFRSKLLSIVGPHSKCSEGRFIDFYNGRRKRIYEAAVQSLGERAVERKDSFLTTFVKAEKINFSAKPDPAPRVIQPRNVRYNVRVGQYLRPLEHHMYHAVDKIWKGPTIMKGYSVEQLGGIVEQAWGEFVSPCAIGFDMKRFDQHVSRSALEWEHSLYLPVFDNDPDLQRLLAWQISNKGWGRASDGSIKYSVDGCRMSGDMNTAMGNCLLACAIVWKFCHDQGIKARLLNNGDDCVLIAERECAAAIEAGIERHWLKFGFQCVTEPTVYKLEHIEFCQMSPVFDGSKYVMVRNPHISLAKDSFSIGPFNTIAGAQKWMDAVGKCGLSIAGGMPVLQSYYRMLARHGANSGGKVEKDVAFASGFYNLARLSNRAEGVVSEESRVSFYTAFGISPDVQTALESHYDNLELDLTLLPQGSQWVEPTTWILNDLKDPK